MTTRSTSASAASALRSGASPGEARGDGARAHDERADARQRRGDRVGQAEGEEVRLGIGAQDAERQHDEARERRAPAPACRRAVHAAHGAQLARPSRRPTPAGPRALGERPADHAIRRPPRPASR